MTTLSKDEAIAMAREAGAVFDPQWGIASNTGTAAFERFATLCRAPLVAEVERLKKDLSTVDVILEECKMDWSGDVTQIKAEHAHELLALQAERDDWKARALKAEQVGEPTSAVPVVEQLVEALCELVQSDGLPRTLEQLDASVKKAFAAIAAGQTFIKESKHA